jgi:serine phosphatase RsbU (regulator of sigma subunit)
MKKLRNWFIGDYLEKTDDVFERSKIELLYNYSIAFFILGGLFSIHVLAANVKYHVLIVGFAVVALGSIPFILKYAENVRAAAICYIVQQTIVSNLSILAQGGKNDVVGGLWLALYVLFSFFLFGRTWGTILTVIILILGGVVGGIAQTLPTDPAQILPETPDVMLLPFLLIVYVVSMFMKTRSDAEKEIHQQKSLLEHKNKEVTDSINYAQRIQTAILPSYRLIESYLPFSFVAYLPKDIVSGDFYWVDKKDSKVFFAVADCTGHGVPGAMMSVICQNALNRVLNEFSITKPSLILDKLSSLVEESFSKSGSDVRDGMDIALCSLDLNSNTLEYAGAHNPIYIISDNELKEIKATKQPIGRFEARVPFTNHELKLKKSDCVYVFSDGIADQFGGPEGKKFKYKRVKEMLLKTHRGTSAEQKNVIISEFSAWKGKNEQIDDVCVMGIKL